MDTTKMIPVQNRNNGTTGYLLPESGIYRSWGEWRWSKEPINARKIKQITQRAKGLE